MKLIDGTHKIGHWNRADGKSVSMHDSDSDAESTMRKLKQMKAGGYILLLAHDGATPWDKSLE